MPKHLIQSRSCFALTQKRFDKFLREEAIRSHSVKRQRGKAWGKKGWRTNEAITWRSFLAARAKSEKENLAARGLTKTSRSDIFVENGSSIFSVVTLCTIEPSQCRDSSTTESAGNRARAQEALMLWFWFDSPQNPFLSFLHEEKNYDSLCFVSARCSHVFCDRVYST